MHLCMTAIRAAQHALRALRDERAVVSLQEVLLVAALIVAIMGPIYSVMRVSSNQGERTESRVRTLIDARNGLERMTRELRQATRVVPQSSQVVEFQRCLNDVCASKKWVRYDCTGSSATITGTHTCARGEAADQASLASAGRAPVVDGVANVDAFNFEPDFVNPTYVTIKLEVRVHNPNRRVSSAQNPLVFSDGFSLRNLTSRS
jgi:hypothetical protein